MPQYIKSDSPSPENRNVIMGNTEWNVEQETYGKYFRYTQKNRYACVVTKIVLMLLVVYEGFYLETGRSIPFLLQGLTLALICCCFFEAPQSISRAFNDPVFLWWFGFGIYCFVSSLIFVGITNAIIDGIYRYFSFLLVCFCAACVTFETKSIDWLYISIILVTVLTCFQVIFHGVSWRNSGYTVVTMGVDNNPNNLGLTMSIGLSVLLYPKRRKSIWLWIINIIISIIVYTIIINAGSRSGLLCSVVILFFSAFAIIRYIIKNSKHIILSTIALIILVFSLAYFILGYFNSLGIQNTGFDRLQNEFNSEAYTGRGDLYSIGIDLFINNPLVGVGYGNFRSYANGLFSHSTYIELLACTGICGFILFVIPYIRMIVNEARMIRSDNRYKRGYWHALLAMLLVSGFFGIVYYELYFMLILYMCLSDSNNIAIKR